jgi:hypothetical protein
MSIKGVMQRTYVQIGVYFTPSAVKGAPYTVHRSSELLPYRGIPSRVDGDAKCRWATNARRFFQGKDGTNLGLPARKAPSVACGASDS